MNVSHAYRAQRLGCCSDGGDQEALVERAQIEAPVEAITKRGKVACRVLSKVERMVATRQSGLEITEDGVDPLELRHLLRLAPGNDGRLVTATCLCDSPKAGQSIGEHRAPRCQMIFRPGGHRLERKAGNRCQPDAQRTIRFVQRNGRNEGHLVLGAASDLATGTLAAEVGVIDLDFPFKQITGFAPSWRLRARADNPVLAWLIR